MRIRRFHLNQIRYNKTEYSPSLKASILRIGFSLPIRASLQDDKLICLDGHKRLSALEDILKENPDYKRGDYVYVEIMDNGDSRSNDSWRRRNLH